MDLDGIEPSEEGYHTGSAHQRETHESRTLRGAALVMLAGPTSLALIIFRSGEVQWVGGAPVDGLLVEVER